MTQVMTHESSKCCQLHPCDGPQICQLQPSDNLQSCQLWPGAMTHLVVSYNLLTTLTDDSNLLSTGYFLILCENGMHKM
jgi:hypothetical protein